MNTCVKYCPVGNRNKPQTWESLTTKQNQKDMSVFVTTGELTKSRPFSFVKCRHAEQTPIQAGKTRSDPIMANKNNLEKTRVVIQVN